MNIIIRRIGNFSSLSLFTLFCSFHFRSQMCMPYYIFCGQLYSSLVNYIDKYLDNYLTCFYKNTKYKLSKKLLENISSIERLYGQLESQIVPKELLLNLEKHNLVKSSFSSNSIEGNPLSQEEVTNLILGGRVPANRDEREVKNYFIS